MQMHALDYAPEEFKTTLPLWTSNYIKDKDGDEGKTAIDNAIAIEVCQKKMMEGLRHFGKYEVGTGAWEQLSPTAWCHIKVQFNRSAWVTLRR